MGIVEANDAGFVCEDCFVCSRWLAVFFLILLFGVKMSTGSAKGLGPWPLKEHALDLAVESVLRIQ